QTIKSAGTTSKRTVFHRVLLEAGAPEPTKGFPLEGTFTSLIRDEKLRLAYSESEKYTASFFMKPTGEFIVQQGQYMPNIRSVPTFPENKDPQLVGDANLEIGATWESAGEEVMKFSKLISVPFNVRYEYRGIENIKSEEGEKSCHKFISNYELSYGNDETGKPRVFGYVTAVWFWDAAQGIPYYATEEYNVILVNDEGVANEFKINSRSYYRKFRKRVEENKIELVTNLKEKLTEQNLPLDVRITDNGVAISLPDVFFETDSVELNRAAKKTINQIAENLKQIDFPHIRVRGHTDSVGDEAYNQELSERRAEQVADFLIDGGELNADKISYDGRGSKDPIADNETIEGRAKNRRVEIILLDK
ncbi:MAG TPA: OmpA family protein, partial [Turneriella sp.]|nr:OmpA family protein [Turneriella sp.]